MGTVNHTTRVKAVEKTQPAKKELWPVLYSISYPLRHACLGWSVRPHLSPARTSIRKKKRRKKKGTLPYAMLYLLINTASGSGLCPSPTNSTSPLPATCIRPAPLLHLQGTDGGFTRISPANVQTADSSRRPISYSYCFFFDHKRHTKTGGSCYLFQARPDWVLV